MRSISVVPSLILVGLGLSGCAATQPVSTRTLLAEMTDLAGMAEFPDPPYTCKQFSSYDRKAKSVEENWFANGDCGQYLRVEEREGRKEHVMMDADGPGAIVRIWSANPKGTLRVYLDQSETPALEAKMSDLLGGKVPGVPVPIAGQRSRGWNCYFPFPYARHCKVTSDEGGFYYHVNYRTYPRGTKVTSFERSDLEKLASEIADVTARLESPRGSEKPPRLFHEDSQELIQEGLPRTWTLELGPSEIAPRDTALLAKVTCVDGAAIVGLRFKVESDDLPRALRKLVLLLEFDGEQTVACPLGDFFGAAPGVNPYESLPMGVTEDGEMWCHWVMPFRSSAQVRIHNTGDQAVGMAHGLAPVEYDWTDRSMHFHAAWRVERHVPTRPMQDWNYVEIKGQGVFAGAAFSIANPVKNWWGEGDEKIYVDGEEFPSHFGTGTEDYYGYAWCCPERFTHAYHNQPRCDGPGNYGHTSVNRWHIIDRIPFERGFRFDMELWHWHQECKVAEMSVVTYWYARPGATSNRVAPQAADLHLTVVPPYVAPRVAGALEGEELRIVAKTGNPGAQGIGACSNEKHLWWRGAKPGDELVVAFPAPAAGKYRVFARFVKANDYGVVQLSLNGQEAGDPLDFYNDGVVVSDELPLGEFDLKAGENRLTAQIVGASEKAAKQYMFGLDYLRLEPAD